MSTSPTFVGLKGQNLVYAVTLCCSFGFLLFGYDLGFMGGLTTSTTFLNVFGNPNASLLGFLVSAYEVGAMFGAIFVFILGDRYGRKTNNIVGAIIVGIGAILQSTTFTLGTYRGSTFLPIRECLKRNIFPFQNFFSWDICSRDKSWEQQFQIPPKRSNC
jgi:MFS family permease